MEHGAMGHGSMGHGATGDAQQMNHGSMPGMPMNHGSMTGMEASPEAKNLEGSVGVPWKQVVADQIPGYQIYFRGVFRPLLLVL